MFGNHNQLLEGTSSEKRKVIQDLNDLFSDELTLSESKAFEHIKRLNSDYNNYKKFLSLDVKSLPGSGIYGKKGHEKIELRKLKKLVNRGWYEKALKRTDKRFRVKYSRLFRLFQDGQTLDAMSLIDEYIERLDKQPESHSISKAERDYLNRLISIWERATGREAAYSANDDNLTGWRSPCLLFIERCFCKVNIEYKSQSSLNKRVIEAIKRRRAF